MPNQHHDDVREASISYRMGLSLFKSGDYAGAVTCFSRSISLVPSCPKYFFSRGHCWRFQNDLLRSLFDYTMAIKIDGSNALYYAYRGITFRKLNRLMEAIQDQTLALNIDPTLDMSFHNRGLCLALLKRHEEAIQDFNQALSINPKSFKVHFNLGCSLFVLGRYNEAASHLKKASQIEGSSSAVYNNLGLCCLHLGQFSDAVSAFSNAIKKSKAQDSIPFLNNRSLAYYALGEFTAGLEDLTSAIGLNKEDPQLFFNRGNTHRSAGHVELAMADLNTAQKLNPNDGLVYYAQGLVHRMQGKEDLATQKFLKALEFEPNYVPIHHQLGLVYFAQGRYVAASEVLEKAVSLAPDVKEYRLCRAKAAYELCEWSIVLKHMNAAIEISEVTSNDLLLRGTAYYRRNLLKESLDDLTKAAELIKEKKSPEVPVEQQALACDPSSACCVSPYVSTETLPSASRQTLGNVAFVSGEHDRTATESNARLTDMIHTALARTERALGKYSEAIHHLSFALNNGQVDSDVLFARAQCYFDLGRFIESIEDITSAIELTESPVLYYWRGRYKKALHDYEGSAHDLETTVKLLQNPHLVNEKSLGVGLLSEGKSLSRGEVHYQLCLVYSHLGKFKSAEESCRLAIENRSMPDLPPKLSLVHEHAKTSQCAGKHHQAIQLFSKVIRHQPNNSRAYFRRAFSYKSVEKFKEAARDFETARRLEPTNPIYVVDYRNVFSIDFFELGPPGMESDEIEVG
ncbi:hypothetical protein P9112_004674 [Eukaryota sp. TZLM1-RC]